MAVPAIQTQQLRKEFGKNIAVDSLTLDVLQGEVFGFLGPNGAGKTTAIKMLLGLVHPTSGSAQILGHPIGEIAIRQETGFLPEHFRFHDWLTGEEFLTLHGQLYNLNRAALKNRINSLLERVGLEEHRQKQLRTYSKGMLQRIGLAQALLNHPRIIFLDEPTSGLDPVGRRLVRDIIHEASSEGLTVFLNSHLLSEVEITCHRVAFIKHGTVLQTSELNRLVEGESTVTIRADGITSEILSGLEKFGCRVRQDGAQVQMTIASAKVLPEITRFLIEVGADIYSLVPGRLSLEDLFIKVVGTDGGL